MTDPSDTRKRVLAALAGEPGLVVGLGFVPSEALEGLRWGGRGPLGILVTACERLSPDFAFVPAEEVWAAEAVDRLAAVGTETFWAVPGPFGVVATRDGWAETVKGTLALTGDVGACMDAEMPRLLELVRRGVRLGAAAVVIAEDVAGLDGLLVAPDYALDEILRRLEQLADAAAQHAVPSVLHSDGDVRALFAGARRAGFAGVHVGGLGREAFERLYEAARAAGLSVLGGLEGEALRAGGPSAVQAGVEAARLSETRGLLVCDDGGITTSEEAAALIEAISAARRGQPQGED